MRELRQFWHRLQEHRLQVTLILSFSLIAAFIISGGMLVTSRVIRSYLDQEALARVRRGMVRGQAIYQDYMATLISMARRVAVHSAPPLAAGGEGSLDFLAEQVRIEAEAFPFEGNRFIIVVDAAGNTRAQSVYPGPSSPARWGNWKGYSLVVDALAQGRVGGSTEVMPVEYLALLGLDRQAHVVIRDTPKAAPELFDEREGHAGLVLIGTAPVIGADGRIIGAVIAGHLLNNDFVLVDRIREVGHMDTATIFLGDLRVSTNVPSPDNGRAVGTRMSAEVSDVVLRQNDVFEQRAFVVNEWYITRYEPLRDHAYRVVGSIYVGMREKAFLGLVSAFNERILLIGLASILLVFLIAIPTARSIARPLAELANASRLVAAGNLDVRVPVHGHGELTTLAECFNDMVATLQDTREELVRKEKLASVGQLAAGVAHEINNPLGTILLYADLMHKELPPDDPRRNDLKMIMDETMRCKRIVGDLLNFARQRQLAVKPTDVNGLIRKTLGEVAIQPTFRRVQIITDLAPDLPLIQADEAQLRQVIVNLVLNAIDAMDDMGQLTVTTRQVPGDMIEMSFRDTGCGIAEEHLGELFTPFFTTKPVGQGTGLGLSIIYGIVKMHRGQITVQSKVGEGTTFTVTLPIRQPTRAENEVVG